MTSPLPAFTAWMFRYRTPLVCLFGILTVAMAWSALHLRVDASFEKTLPTRHEYIGVFSKYKREV